MNASPQRPADGFGYAEALDLVHRGRMAEAREKARKASVSASAGPRAGSIGDLMAAALTELLAAMPDTGFSGYTHEHREHAEAIMDIALAARRPAWAAAARAINGVGLVSMGRLEDGLQEFVTAEVELAREIEAGTQDPWGKPQGVAAGHNNLGYAYLLLQAFELAQPHLTSAMSISRWGYGPELSVQAEMDVFNLGELHLRWAIALDAAGERGLARAQIDGVLEATAALTRRPGHEQGGPWADAATVLECGARSVAEPGSLDEVDLSMLRRFSDGDELTFLHNLARCLLAMVASRLGEPDTAREAAKRVIVACASYDSLLTDCAGRANALAEAHSDGSSTTVRQRLDHEGRMIEAQRQAFTAQLQERIAAALAQ